MTLENQHTNDAIPVTAQAVVLQLAKAILLSPAVVDVNEIAQRRALELMSRGWRAEIVLDGDKGGRVRLRFVAVSPDGEREVIGTMHEVLASDLN